MYGIFARSNQTSPLTAYIKNNYVTSAHVGIDTEWVAGTISGNNISASAAGVDVLGAFSGSPSITVSGNVVTSGNTGISVRAAAVVSGNTVNNTAYAGVLVHAVGTVTANHIFNSHPCGIYLKASDVSIKSNTITQTTIGIEFGCSTGTVSGNIINGASTGLDSVPAAFTGGNTFYNVSTVRTGC
jgi:copper-binding protein NosD